MTVYRFTHKKSRKVATIPESKLHETLLEVAGGGYTVKQTTNAMMWLDDLRVGKTVITQNFVIMPIHDVGPVH